MASARAFTQPGELGDHGGELSGRHAQGQRRVARRRGEGIGRVLAGSGTLGIDCRLDPPDDEDEDTLEGKVSQYVW